MRKYQFYLSFQDNIFGVEVGGEFHRLLFRLGDIEFRYGNSCIAQQRVADVFVYVQVADLLRSRPYWLVTDGKLKNPKFIQIGLWMVCFNGFEEVHHWYDTVFTGCWWIFEEEYYIIHDTLLPGFFIATQFFFTISLCCVLASIFMTYLYLQKDKDDDNYLTLLVTLGTTLVIGETMKNRSLAGNCGIGVFVIALVTVALAFGTPSWLVSDDRIRGARLDRSLPDPLDQYQRRFFVGCRFHDCNSIFFHIMSLGSIDISDSSTDILPLLWT
ncbi:hypothetical protein MSG28_000385 [Choristoneura fumiferana]|uniref:Uncharacterized protein n=1 Tax=Choristoneura fumiferana TaxID=7141 RepID=A0ACC0K0N4_CHOFU|nr:hypothetical protein MSG28_000385 [Choristoneura fumiferana]